MDAQFESVWRFEAVGKQVLREGTHYADAKDEVAAREIVNALNFCSARFVRMVGSEGPTTTLQTVDNSLFRWKTVSRLLFGKRN